MDYISHSQLSTYGSCRQKWYYGYVERIKPKKTSSNFYFGTLFHLGMEVYYSNKMNDVEDQGLVIQEVLKRHVYEINKLNPSDTETISQYNAIFQEVQALVQWYMDRQDSALFTSTVTTSGSLPMFVKGFRIIDIEYSKQVQHTNLNTPLFGRFDMIIEDNMTKDLFIVDHKTTKFIGEDMATYYMDQAYFYMAMATHISDEALDPSRIKGVIFNCVKKTLPKFPKLSSDGKKWNSIVSNSGTEEAKGSLSTDLVELLDFMDGNPSCYDQYMTTDIKRSEIIRIYSDVKKQHNQAFFIPYNKHKVEMYIKYINGATQDMVLSDFPSRNTSKMSCGMCSYMEVCHAEHIQFDEKEARRIKNTDFELRNNEEYEDLADDEVPEEAYK